MILPLLGCLLLCASCRRSNDTTASDGELARQIRPLLYGGQSPTDRVRCSKDSQCPSFTCSTDYCDGLLFVKERWIQREITQRLRKRAKASAPYRAVVLRLLGSVATDDKADVMMRARAIMALSRFGGAQALSWIRRVAQSPVPQVRLAAELALARLGQTSVVPALIKRLKTKNILLKLEIIKALGAARSPLALNALKARLSDESHFVQLSAARAVAQLDSPQVVPTLVNLLATSDDDFLKYDAARALRRLTGQSLGVRAAAWQRWLKSRKRR